MAIIALIINKKIINSLLFLTICFLWMNASATILYRNRLPFSLTAYPQDKLILRYDFSGKTGLYCSADGAKTKILFSYKGREKSAYLPVTLQSALPENETQELADVKGRAQITVIGAAQSKQKIIITCRYEAAT